MSNEPIEPQDFLGGVKVIDIGDIRVARGLTRRPASSCRHRRMHYDETERRIWCADCERDLDGFEAFRLLVEQFSSAHGLLARWQERLKEAEQFQIRSLAAKEIDKAWRSRTMVPACPCCNEGLFPEDFKHGPSMINREWASARRSKRRGAKP